MQTLQDEKAARLACAGKNKETCDGDTVVGFDGAGQPQKAGANVRMGREVPIIKKASSCDSEKDTNCSDKKVKEEIRENRSSSLV
ncbi:MAG TPA: hypothetical protein VIK53_01860 [Verrucomicrobiae bacterium]